MYLKNSNRQNSKPINILIVLGEFNEKLNFVGICKTKNELEDFLKKQVPDIIIMDISLGKHDGIEITKEILEKLPDIKVVIYSIDCHIGIVQRAIRSGASGFFFKIFRHPFFISGTRKFAEK